MDWEDAFGGSEGLVGMEMVDDESVGLCTKMFEGAGRIYGCGTTFMDEFNCDPHASKCATNIYYPFASKK
jgi:hypothetical protein